MDGKECTQDVCTGNAPSNPPVTLGTSCSTGKCNGVDACVQCNVAGDCPVGTFCKPAACTTNVCGFTNTAVGTDLPGGQTPNDCKVLECDGNGGQITSNDNTDVPLPDTLDCTVSACNAGNPVQNPMPLGTTCDDNGGKVCDNAGNCVACNVNGDCSGGASCQNHVCVAAGCSDNIKNGTETDIDCGGSCAPCAIGKVCAVLADCVVSTNVCVTNSCTGNVCTATNVADNTPTAAQTAGDCQEVQCNGAGATKSVANNADVPASDGNPCTYETCSSGAISTGNEPIDTICQTTKFCNGGGACVECTKSTQCTDLNCVSNACVAATCTDTIKNGSESDVDCGGTCNDCKPGKACLIGTDCETGICTGNICQAPDVTSTSPANAATNVPVTSPIAITFNTQMNPATLTAQAAGGTCTGSVQVSRDDFVTCIGLGTAVMSNANATATFTPAPGLSQGIAYKIRVTAAAQDAFANALGLPYTSTTGFTTVAPLPLGPQVVISQVYGGGNNGGAPYRNDFVELHNRGAVAVDISTWSVQWTSVTGTWTDASAVTALSGNIAPGGYYLVKLAGGTTNGVDLPTADATGASTVGAGSFKIALVSNTTKLTGSGCPLGGAIVDFVAAGSTADCYEGTGPAPAPSNTTSIIRRDSGCSDTNSNATDFITGAPNPRNSTTANNLACNLSANETGDTLELDWCNIQSPTTLTTTAGVATEMVYARLYEAGVTPGGGALPATLVGQVGFGPANVNPETQSGWTWANMAINAAFVDANNEEFQGAFTPAIAGSYKYGVRMSLDGGTHWTYCDLNGAGSNANLYFETSQLPTLTVN